MDRAPMLSGLRERLRENLNDPNLARSPVLREIGRAGPRAPVAAAYPERMAIALGRLVPSGRVS